MSELPLAPATEGPIILNDRYERLKKDFSQLVEAARETSEWLERLATMPEDERRAVSLSAVQKRATAHNTRLREALAAVPVERGAADE